MCFTFSVRECWNPLPENSQHSHSRPIGGLEWGQVKGEGVAIGYMIADGKGKRGCERESKQKRKDSEDVFQDSG